jgi:hypothetical protein
MSKSTYGVIRYLPGPGVPEDDEAHFDGWYTDKNVAGALFMDWKRRWPRWIVALVASEGDVHFGDNGIEVPQRGPNG